MLKTDCKIQWISHWNQSYKKREPVAMATKVCSKVFFVIFHFCHQVEKMWEVWTKSVTMRATLPIWECKCLQRMAINIQWFSDWLKTTIKQTKLHVSLLVQNGDTNLNLKITFKFVTYWNMYKATSLDSDLTVRSTTLIYVYTGVGSYKITFGKFKCDGKYMRRSTRKQTLWTLRKVSTRISLSLPHRLTRTDTVRLL